MRTLIHLLVFVGSIQLGSAVDLPQPDIERLEAEVVDAEASAAANGIDANEAVEIARSHLRIGKYETARIWLEAALASDPDNSEAFLTLSEIALRRYEFESAARFLIEAEGGSGRSPRLLALQVRLALRTMDFVAAKHAISEFAKIGSSIAQLRLLESELAFAINDLETARALADEAVASEPSLARAHLLLGRIHKFQGRFTRWPEETRRAIEIDPLDSDARAEMALALGRAGRLREASDQALVALRLDRYSFAAHHHLGRGYSPRPYPDPPWSPEIDRARAALTEGRIEDAVGGFTARLADEGDRAAASVGIGFAAFARGDDDSALAWFFRALESDPLHGLAHFGVTEVLQHRLDGNNQMIVGRPEPVPRNEGDQVPGLREVFVNFDSCSLVLQDTVRHFVGPTEIYLQTLAESGATVYFLDPHQFIWEAPNLSSLRGTRTIDLRLYDDLKGLGGSHTVSNKLQQERAAVGRWSVAAHEYAHQIQTVMTRSQRRTLKDLFIRAKREDRTLDWYAALNDWEYFAQAYEAFIWETKLPDQKGSSGHTRAELHRVDPDMYRFIEGLEAQHDSVENGVTAWVARSDDPYLPLAERTAILTAAIDRYGRHRELLLALGSRLRQAGDLSGALDLHIEASSSNPGFLPARIELFRTLTAAGESTRVLVSEMETLAASHETDANLLILLGGLYLEEGRFEEAAVALERALAIDPYPDPYDSDFARPNILLARALVGVRAFERAEKAYRRALEGVNRNDPTGWAELAEVLLRCGRVEEAAEALEVAQILDPDDPAVMRASTAVADVLAERSQILLGASFTIAP